MKPARVLLIGLGVLVALLLVGVLLAFNSGVQTWAARRALNAQPDLEGQIGRVSVGLQTVEAEDVVLRRPGMRLTLPRLEMDVAVLRAARERLVVRRLVAKGWTLDLTVPAGASPTAWQPLQLQAASFFPLSLAAATPPSAADRSTPFPLADVLGAIELPVDLERLDGVELEGDVIFPTSDTGGVGRAHVRITGGGLAPGQEGNFQIDARSHIEDPAAPVSSLDAQSQVGATLRDPRRFGRIEAHSTVAAQGEQLPPGTQLLIDAVIVSADAGGRYTLAVRTPEKPLFMLEASPAGPDTDTLAGEWRIEMSHEDVAPFALGFPLPVFSALGQGTVEFSPADEGVSLAGSLEARLSQLESLRPELARVGPMTVQSTFAARRAAGNVRVTQLHLTIAEQRPVAELRALQGVEFNLATGELRVADPDADLLEVQLRGLPLEWAQGMVGNLAISGAPLQGSWLAAARDGGFSLRPTSPLRAGNLTLAQGEQVIATGVNLAVSPWFEYNASGWQGRAEEGYLEQAGQRLVEFDARAGQAAQEGASLVATTRFRADLAACLTLPVAEAYRYLQAGVAEGDVIVALSDHLESAAKLELQGLVATSGEALPRLVVDLRADRAADGRIEAHVPLVVTRDGRVSDLTIDAQLRPDGAVTVVEALVTGEHVFVQDVQLLAAPFAGASEEDPDPEEADAPPPWAGLRGKITLALGTVVYSEQLRVSNVNGEIALDGDTLSIPTFRAAMGTGGTVEMRGQLQHQASGSASYALQSDIVANQVDVGPLLRAFNPNATPPVEGVFDFTSQLSAEAAELGSLGSAAQFDARLSSRGGTLRALPLRVTEVARAGSALAGLIGGLTGDSRTQRLAEGARAAAQFAQAVGALSFDQLNVEVARAAGGEIAVRDVSIISPLIRLLGSGSIRQQGEQPFWQRPLDIRLQLGARGEMANHLRTLRLLKQDADTLGYIPMVEDFTLQGSLYDISVPQLQSLLSRAVASIQSGSPPPASPPAPAPQAAPPPATPSA